MTPALPADFSSLPFPYQFKNPALLEEALTHKSHVNERKGGVRPHNERLEFLGDAVLSLIVSDHLARLYPQLSEGSLSKLKATLVSEASLAQAARRLKLGSLLRLGRGEERSQGREKPSLLADALEAVIAAVYLDAGFEAAKALVLGLWGGRIGTVESDARDPKTSLQEWAQARAMPPPAYIELGRDGPDHQPQFTVQVRLENGAVETARAGTKRAAEQAAARALLSRMEQKND